MTAAEEIPQLMAWYVKGKTHEDAKIDEWLIRTVREVESLIRRLSPSKPFAFESSEDWPHSDDQHTPGSSQALSLTR